MDKPVKLRLLVLLFFILFPLSSLAQEKPGIGVALFQVNGPESAQYLSGATRDAVVGALIQKNQSVEGLSKVIDPEKLANPRQGGKNLARLVTGRINVVGNQYRVLLKWVDGSGALGQDYLQADRLEELLPKLESFAQQQLPIAVHPVPPPVAAAPPASVPAAAPPAPLSKQQKKELEKKQKEEAKAAIPPAQPVVQEQPVKQSPKAIAKEEKKNQGREVPLRDYDYVSKRLPFEVRSLNYGDVDGDGQKEVLLTSQNSLYLYSFNNRQMELIAEYPGAKLDYFVKVDLYSRPGEKPLVVLTNLRGYQASSKILRYEGKGFVPVIEDVPFQMRVVHRNDTDLLIGSTYSAQSTKAPNNIFKLEIIGNEVKPTEKLDLPWGTNLYSYDWLTDQGAEDVVKLTTDGKVQLFVKKDSKDYKKAWTSPDNYGGTGNWVPVEVHDIFNEVVSDYYPIPVGVYAHTVAGKPEIVVVKNDSLVKNVIGRIPVIKDGQIFRLTFDELGFVEAWASKKIDGSVQDYLVTSVDGQTQLMAAVRLRDPGLLGDVGKNDSVLLLYNLD
jgi:hypothetical protein